MKATALTRLFLGAIILTGVFLGCALILQGNYVAGLILAIAAISASLASHYVYSIRPISQVVEAFEPQLAEVGFEPCDPGQLRRVGYLLAQTRTLGDRPIDVLQGVGARTNALSVVWVQYVARKNLQMGFAWLAGFPQEFRGPGRLIPRLRRGAETPTFEEMFEPDNNAIENLLGEMTLPIRRELQANRHFLYEFDGPHLLADFYVSRDTCAQAREAYFATGVAAFLHLLETIHDNGAGLFKPADD